MRCWRLLVNVRQFWVCLVSEKRAELTTEGSLDVGGQITWLTDYIRKLQAVGIKVSLFIDPEEKQIAAAIECGADAVELHQALMLRQAW